MREREQLEGLGVERRKILKWFFKEVKWVHGLDLCGLG